MYQYLEIYITELSKYFITAFIVLYVLQSIPALIIHNEDKKNGIYARQTILMFLVHFTCFISICFETGEVDYLIFYIFQQILLFATILLFKVVYPTGDRFLVNNMCMLLSIGFIILTRISYNKAVKQFFIVAISIILCILIPVIIEKFLFLKRLTWIYAILGIASLGCVMILGSVTNGSKISYSIGGITFQPSEIVKIIFIFFIASAYANSATFKDVLITACVAGMHVLILVMSKDLGSALIFFFVYVLLTLISTKNFIYAILGFGGGSAAAVMAYKLFSHVQVRVQAWKDPWSVIDDAGYQIAQSLFAISSGGNFGLGLFRGNPSNIPFVEADFIFSAIAEELGIIFALCLILICTFTFIRIMRISFDLHNQFYQYIASGIGITYIFQVFLTIAGGVKFVPMTGITLPLISYGGTSVLTTLVMIFILQGLVMISQKEALKVQEIKRKKHDQKKKLDD